MDIKNLIYGVIHSQIGKNDGVSIVIDQTIHAMTEQLHVPLGNIHFLSGISAARMQSDQHNAFWHRSDANIRILSQFSSEPDEDLDEFIMEKALLVKEKVAEFVEKNDIDMLIVHNSCHPSNFVYSVGIGLYFDEIRKQGFVTPKYLLWWHDSHFERDRFSNPNDVIKKYLQYIPGPHVDGIIFINSQQASMAKSYCDYVEMSDVCHFFDRKTSIIPNTCSISWDWRSMVKEGQPLFKKLDGYNNSFFKDIGLESELKKRGYNIDDVAILLQHTRIVKRKRIDHAIDFAFKLEKKFSKECQQKPIALIVSGNSGDEHDKYKDFLYEYFDKKSKEFPESAKNIIFIMAENVIFHTRELLPDRKLYSFQEIPAVVARAGGMGTYFSEVEGYGNNLLEMLEAGLPVIMNEYDVYKSDIKHLELDLIETQNGEISEEHIDRAYDLLTNPVLRYRCVKKNLEVLEEKLNHGVMADKVREVIRNLFRYK